MAVILWPNGAAVRLVHSLLTRLDRSVTAALYAIAHYPFNYVNHHIDISRFLDRIADYGHAEDIQSARQRTSAPDPGMAQSAGSALSTASGGGRFWRRRLCRLYSTENRTLTVNDIAVSHHLRGRWLGHT